MDNSVNLPIRLIDYVKEPLKGIGTTSHSVFGGVDRDIAGTQERLNDLGRPVELRVNTAQAQGAVNGLAESMKGLSEMQLIGGMTMGSLAADGIMRSFDFAKEQITDVLAGGMEESMTKMGINVMAGGQEIGEKLYGSVKNYLKHSMYGSELFDATSMLLQFHEKADNIPTDIKEIGDIARGSGERVKELAMWLGRVAGSGHLTGMEQMRMTMAGFNPLQEIGRTTGMGMPKLEELMSEGKITADMVRGAFKSATEKGGLFDDYMKKVMATAAGQYKMAVTNFDETKKELGEELQPSIGVFLKDIQPVLDALPEELERMRPAMEGVITGLGDMVRWTSNNTETLGKLVGVLKVGAEAWVAWKVGTAAATAANWLWTLSMTSGAVASTAMAEDMAVENGAIAQQIEEVDALTFSWASLAEAKAANAAAAGAANLPIMMSGTVRGMMPSAGGMLAGLSQAVIPVMIAYFGGEAVAQMLDANPFTGEGWDMKKIASASSNPYMNMGLGASVLSTFGFDPIQDALAALQEKNAKPVMDIGDVIAGNWGADKKGRNPYFPNLPDQDEMAKGMTQAAGGSTASVSDAIVGGGSKQVHINFRNFTEHFTIKAEHMDKGAQETFRMFEEWYLRLLKSVPG